MEIYWFIDVKYEESFAVMRLANIKKNRALVHMKSLFTNMTLVFGFKLFATSYVQIREFFFPHDLFF